MNEEEQEANTIETLSKIQVDDVEEDISFKARVYFKNALIKLGYSEDFCKYVASRANIGIAQGAVTFEIVCVMMDKIAEAVHKSYEPFVREFGEENYKQHLIDSIDIEVVKEQDE